MTYSCSQPEVKTSTNHDRLGSSPVKSTTSYQASDTRTMFDCGVGLDLHIEIARMQRIGWWGISFTNRDGENATCWLRVRIHDKKPDIFIDE